ncbi:unnamed protein product, partial [Ectocarpus sp. 6 AP-2014]
MDGGKWERTDTAYRADECITMCVRSISRPRSPCSQRLCVSAICIVPVSNR